MRGFPRHVLALTALAIFTLLQYRQLALNDRILTGYDTLTYFYPHEQFAAEALKSGSLPLWNPYLFTGVPFLANLQTEVFYPLNVVFLLLSIPRAYAWSVVLHAFLSAAFAYAFAGGSLRLRPTSAFIAAAVYAFSGFLTALSSHLNQLQASAWLPLILLLAHKAYASRSWRWTAAGALAVATQLSAGHLQEFYISSVGVVAFVGWLALTDVVKARMAIAANGRRASGRLSEKDAATRRARSFSMTMGGTILVAVMFGLGVALAGVQVLPSFELTQESIRSGGLGVREASAFSLPPWMLLRALLPAHGDSQPFSEWAGYVGLVALVLAALATLRSRHPFKLFFLIVAACALLLALGQFSPVYAWAYDTVPGLNLFRVPARWLLLYTLSLAILAGLGLETSLEKRSARRRPFLAAMAPVGLVATFVAVIWLAATRVNLGKPVELPGNATLALWIASALAALVVINLGLTRGRRAVGLATAILVSGELLTASQGAEINRVNLSDAFSALRPAIAHLLTRPGVFRVLPFSEATFDPGDLAQLRTMVSGALTPEGVYDYVVATKHKETLTPNLPLSFRIASLDGYDGGILPLRRYVGLKQLFPLASANTPDGRLREQLHAIPDARLLGWLNVRYVLTDRTRDAWNDGIYYDLGFTKELVAAEELRLTDIAALESTAVGIVSHLKGATAVANGSPVARLSVTLEDGRVFGELLRAGEDTAEGRYGADGPPAHREAPKAKAWRGDPAASDYATLVRLPIAGFIREIRIGVQGADAVLAVRGISIVDERRQLSEPVVIDSDFRLTHLGDVKIYENLRALERAFLVHEVATVASGDKALEAMMSPKFDPTHQAVIEGRRPQALEEPKPDVTGDKVIIAEYRPELVRVTAESNQDSLLILTDSFYPGWTVRVDGQAAEMLRVDYLFRGVVLPRGKHEVLFEYQPRSLLFGAAVSVVTLLAIVALLVAPKRKAGYTY